MHLTAFCLGALAAHLPTAVAAQLGDFLKALQPLCAIPAKLNARTLSARDNACSAVGKVVMAVGAGHGANKVDLGAAVQLFLSALPIRADFAEAESAYGVLLSLFQNAPQLVLPHLKSVMEILMHAVLDTNLSDAMRGQLVHLAKSLIQVCNDLCVRVARCAAFELTCVLLLIHLSIVYACVSLAAATRCPAATVPGGS